jgi:large subunit ribosomal protein L17
MFRNMVTSLLKHDRIRTTGARAKEVRRWADHLITLAKRGDLHARRQALSIVREKDVVHKLFEQADERFGAVSGGYTRVIKLGKRPGDAASMSMVELITLEGTKKKKAKKKKTKSEGRQKKEAGDEKAPAAAKAAKADEKEKASAKTKDEATDKKDVAEVEAKTQKPTVKGAAAKTSDKPSKVKTEPAKAKTESAKVKAEPTVGDTTEEKPAKKTKSAPKKPAATADKKDAPDAKTKKAAVKKTAKDEK